MRGLDWVMSAGGALICIGDDYVPFWGGILRLTIDSGIKKNDYERTYGLSRYADVVPLSKGNALLFGQGPLDTSFWIDKNQTIYIIRIYFCDSHADDTSFDKIMQNLDESLFERPREVLDFDVASSRLVMFDSANDGTDIDDKVVSVDIEPGRYRVLTQTYDPDPTCSLVLHRFDRLA